MVNPAQFAGRKAGLRPDSYAREDAVFRGLIVLALLLEVVVYIEPAPVDLLLLVCLAMALTMGKLRFPTLSVLPVVALVAFGLANLLSMYDPIDPSIAFKYMLVTFYLAGTWFFFVGVEGRYGKSFMALMINTYCAAGFVSALLGIGAYFGLIPFKDTLLLGGRARGLFKDCNVYGPFFVPVALFALTRIMDSRSTLREKGPSVAVLISSVLAMLLCFSRACWINFGLALAIFLTGQVAFRGLRSQLSPREIRARMRAGIGLLFAGGVLLAAINEIPVVSDMMSQRLTSNGLQYYDRVRFATQDLALETAKQHLLGIGPGQVELAFDYATHSMYVRILTENGALALIALLVFIGATAWRSICVIERAEDPWYRELNLVVLACIAGHLVNSFVIDTVHWRHIWFIYALPWAPARLRSYSVAFASRMARIDLSRRPVLAGSGFTGR
jgi:hypothetical protein